MKPEAAKTQISLGRTVITANAMATLAGTIQLRFSF